MQSSSVEIAWRLVSSSLLFTLMLYEPSIFLHLVASLLPYQLLRSAKNTSAMWQECSYQVFVRPRLLHFC